MNSYIRMINRNVTLGLLVFALATAIPLLFVDWGHYIWSSKKLGYVIMLGMDLFSISVMALCMIIFSLSKKGRSIDYAYNVIAVEEAKMRHQVSYILMYIGFIMLVSEAVLFY